MNTSTKLIVATIATLICIAAFTQVSLAAEPVYLVEYPLTGKPLNIAVEAPDKVWFTMPDDDAIGFLNTTDPNNPQFTPHALPVGSEPHDIVYDNGFVWFTEKGSNRIGRINVSNGQLDAYDIPTANSGPTGIDVAPNGVVWFLEQGADKLAKFDPTTETFNEYQYTVNAGMEDIVVVDNNQIQFTAPERDELVKYEPSSDQFAPVTTRPPNSSIAFAEPMGITVDRVGVIWLTSFADSYIGRFAGGTTGNFRWSPTPGPDAGPAQIVFYDGGHRWSFFYSEYNSGRVSWLSTLTNSALAGTVSYPLSSPNAQPWGVDVDANGCAWFALTGINAVAEWCAPYARQNWLPIVLTAQAQ